MQTNDVMQPNGFVFQLRGYGTTNIKLLRPRFQHRSGPATSVDALGSAKAGSAHTI